MQSSEILEILTDLEQITEINGCFLLRSVDNAIVESTIPLKIPDDILWEVAVLRDTFQQFAKGVSHGKMEELMLQGDRGFIFMYNLTNDFILLALGPKQINLPYYKLGMFDVIKRIKTLLEKEGSKYLSVQQKELGAVGEGYQATSKMVASETTQATQETASIPSTSTSEVTAPVVEEPQASASEVTAPVVEEPQVSTPEVIAPIVEEPQVSPISVTDSTTTPIIEETKMETAEIGEKLDILDLISSIRSNSDLSAKYNFLGKAFNQLKDQMQGMTGTKVSEFLEKIKDAILEFIGASLALFDISKTSREISKDQKTLTPQKVAYIRDRIDNWAKRIIK